MAKGFGKSISNKRLSRYAPLSKSHKSLVRGLEKFTSCIYGEDFILDYRDVIIYARKNVIQALDELKSELEQVLESASIDLLQRVINRVELTNNIEESEFFILMREACLWYGYTLLNDGNEPRIEKDLCFYTEEELEQIANKLNEIAPVEKSIDESIEKVLAPFMIFLKSQGYFYYLFNNKMAIPD